MEISNSLFVIQSSEPGEKHNNNPNIYIQLRIIYIMLNNKGLNSYKDARKSLMCIVISSGESSWMKWLPSTVTSLMFTQDLTSSL